MAGLLHCLVVVRFGSAILFQRLISDIRPEDFEIEYNSANRFRFMGNGFTEFEMKEGNDLSFYVEVADESPSC